MKVENPYQILTDGSWLRGNLHAHTDRSDGRRPPQTVIDDYAARGYDFLMISDHDMVTCPDEFHSNGMILIPGNEVSADGPHILHVNTRVVVRPSPRRQEVLAAIADAGGFAVVNHPNWQRMFDHCTIQQLTEWTGFAGMEIYNGTIGRLDGSPYATNKWDILLSQGRRVWGFANDDSHLASEDVGLGWNMVYARERSAQAILASLQSGNFYASTGVTITGITVDQNRIKISTRDAERIVAIMQVGRRFAQVDSTELEIIVPENAEYVRFECWGRGERFAWTQPFFVKD